MTGSIALEVIGGPMDGLRCLIDKKGTVGRKVGNSLSLALDDEVSGRHLEVVKEGHDWCIRDLNSTNGTLWMSEKLQPGRSYPVKTDDVILLGSTVLLIDAGREGEENIPFTDFSFNDPRTCYAMTPGLSHVWNRLFYATEEDHTVNHHFCDVDRLFVAMMESAAEMNEAGYACVSQVKEPDRYQILAKWLGKLPMVNSCSGQQGSLTVASRTWKVMNIAVERKNGAIGIGDILGAILEEGGSLAARYMRNDKPFMEDFGSKLRRGASDKTVIDIVRTSRKNVAAAPPGLPRTDVQSQSPPIAPPAPNTSGTQATAALAETWKIFGQRLERLVSGFLADAINPVASRQDFRPPGLEKTLDEVLTGGAANPVHMEQQVKQYLDTLYNLLVVILASQHDGYRSFGDFFCTTLGKSVSEIKDGRSLMLPIGKKSVDVEELMASIKAVHRKVETDGISEDIVRDLIRKKIQQLGF